MIRSNGPGQVQSEVRETLRVDQSVEQARLQRTCFRAGGVAQEGRLIFRPISDPDQAIDVTEALTSAVAYELWERFGETAEINWLEAEILVQGLLGHVEALFTQRAVDLFGNFEDSSLARPRRAWLWETKPAQTGDEAA